MIRIFLVWTGALGIGITFGVIAGLLLKFLREYLPATRVGLLVGGVAWVAAGILFTFNFRLATIYCTCNDR